MSNYLSKWKSRKKDVIDSYGIICYRIKENQIEYLIICRHISFGFDEFIRGHYDKNNMNYIQGLLNEMTKEELEMILHESEENILNYIYCSSRKVVIKSISEKNNEETDISTVINTTNVKSKIHYLSLRLKYLRSNDDFLKKINNPLLPKWNTPEWGFPKGRRDNNETSLTCALREFYEETKINTSNLKINNRMKTFVEYFEGSDQKQYRHTYFVAEIDDPNGPSSIEIDNNDIRQRREVSSIKWVTLDEAKYFIRYTDSMKIRFLECINNLLCKGLVKKNNKM